MPPEREQQVGDRGVAADVIGVLADGGIECGQRGRVTLISRPVLTVLAVEFGDSTLGALIEAAGVIAARIPRASLDP